MTTKDDDGLTLKQRRYLAALDENPDQKQAAKKAKVDPSTPRRWMREDEAFRRAYNEIFGGSVEASQQRSQLMAEKALDALDELLEEEKPIPVKCPGCGHKFAIEIRDSAVRARVGEMVLKTAGVLKDIRRIEGGVVHLLTTEERLALTMLRMGKQISAALYDNLDRRNLIPPELQRELPPGVIVEGEAKEVPNG